MNFSITFIKKVQIMASNLNMSMDYYKKIQKNIKYIKIWLELDTLQRLRDKSAEWIPQRVVDKDMEAQ